MKKLMILAAVLGMVLFGSALSEALSLPANLKVVSEQAFYGDASVTKVVLHNKVKSIGPQAFAGSGLKEIILPDGIDSIADDAFEGCDGLIVYCAADNAYVEAYCKARGFELRKKEADASVFTVRALDDERCEIISYSGSEKTLVIPAEINGLKVASIGERAFNRKSLKTVYLPEYLEELKKEAFYNCELLEYVYFPENMKSVNPDSFYRQTSSCEYYFFCEADWPTAQLLFPEDGDGIELGMTNYLGFFSPSMPEYCLSKTVDNGDAYLTIEAYRGNTSILRVPQYIDGVPVKKVDYLYPGSEKITSLTLPEGIVELGGLYDSKKLQYISLPDSLRVIKEGCFQNCSGLDSIALPEELKVISRGAFEGCTGVESMVIPSGVTALENQTFYTCTSLKWLYVPETVRKLGEESEDSVSGGIVTQPDNLLGGDSENWPTIICEEYSYAASWADMYGVPYMYTEEAREGTDTQEAIRWFSLPDRIEVLENESITLRPVRFLPAVFDDQVLVWQSSDPDIVSVDENGTITAKAPGTCTIWAYFDYSDIDDTIEVTVVRHMTDFDLSYSHLEMEARDSVKIEICNIQPEGSSGSVFVWTSSDPVIATVDQTGLVTARAVGEVTITVTSSEGLERNCTIKVRKPD